MRQIARMLVALIVAGGFAASSSGQMPRKQAAPPRAPANANAKVPSPADLAAERAEMDKLLGLWEQQSARLTSLVVSYKRVDKSPGWNEEIEYEGNAYLQTPSLACLHSKKNTAPPPKPGQKPVSPTFVDHERIVCTGKEVLQYDYASKEIFRFPLDKQARKKALEEGPLPFLFNMKAEETKTRYSMSLHSQNAKAYLIAVLPRLDEDKEVFSRAFIQLNKQTFLPDRLMLVSPNEKDTQDYRFNQVEANKTIDPKFFQAALTIKGWKLIDNPIPAQPARRNPADEPGRNSPARGAVGQRPGLPAR